MGRGLRNQVVKEPRMLSKVDKKKVGAIVDSVVHGYKAAKKADVPKTSDAPQQN